MRRFIFASHGQFAAGLAHTVELVTNKKGLIRTVCAYEANVPVADEVAESLADIPDEDELVILTDIAGGSVNQAYFQVALERPRTLLLSGANVPLAMALVLHPERRELTPTVLDKLVDQARQQLVSVSLQVTNDDDDE